jgi:hypothetical protein
MPVARVPRLTPNEQWLANEVARRRPVDGRVRTGGDRMIVTARALRDLVRTASRPFGVRLSGLQVLGELDLSYAEIKGPIAITDSEFSGHINWQCGIGVSLDLSDTSFRRLLCGGAKFAHSLWLSGVRGSSLELADAKIGGGLELSRAILTGADGIAVFADGIEISGAMSCQSGFSATGAVHMSGADIGGALALTGGEFHNSGGVALSLNRARIGLGVFGREGFAASGEVRMLGVTIGGQLGFAGGKFNNPGGDALSLDGAKIDLGVFCGDGFTANGEVRMVGAEIGGALALAGGKFNNPSADALSLDRARIIGSVFCGDGFTANGEVRMLGAEIKGQLALAGGKFNNPGGHALSLGHARITGSIFCGGGFIASGIVSIVGAEIGGHLDLTDGQLGSPGRVALSAEHAQIDSLIFAKAGDGSSGEIDLTGAHIRYLQDHPAAWRPFGKVSLLDLTYDRVTYGDWTSKQRIQWLKMAGTHQNQPYEQLASTLRAQGHERYARKILIAKHTQQRRQQPWRTRMPGLLFGALLAYGYRPLQRTLPLLFALYVVGAFWLLPQARDAHAVIATRVPVHTTTVVAPSPTGQPAQPITATKHCPADYPCFSPWAYTLDVLVPLVNTRQTDYWTVVSRHGDQGAIWYIRLAPALGWILSTAAALGFTGLIRRD